MRLRPAVRRRIVDLLKDAGKGGSSSAWGALSGASIGQGRLFDNFEAALAAAKARRR
jgi:hypothetical protein